ncbi:MAG: hypothetical protein LBF60_00785 [Treponema sp.]|jgi:hypothetical protein|nr:hypothetical protein [Treponema sp.]
MKQMFLVMLTLTFVGCLTFEEVRTPIENPDEYLEKESVVINEKDIIMGEYTLKWEGKIHNTKTNGNNYYEIRGDKFILYRDNIPLYKIENILIEDGYIRTTQKSTAKFYTGKKSIYVYDNNKKIEYTLSEADNIMFTFYDNILGAIIIENMFFDGVLFKTRSGFKIIIDGNEYGLFSYYEPNFYRRKDYPRLEDQNKIDKIILFTLAVFEISQKSFLG